MQRGFYSRILATVLSVWLAVCLAEPARLHVCAMHGGLAIDGSPAPHSMRGHTHQDQSSDHQSKQCSCLGDCATGHSPVGVISNEINLGRLQIVDDMEAIPAGTVATVDAPPFFLPFSNGPPVLSRT